MSLSIKKGVRLHGLSTPILLAVMIAREVYAEFNYDCVITAGIDGKHTNGSSHYAGNAVDLRTNNLLPGVAEKILAKIQERLNEDYFAQVEADHLHIQWKPQSTYGA